MRDFAARTRSATPILAALIVGLLLPVHLDPRSPSEAHAATPALDYTFGTGGLVTSGSSPLPQAAKATRVVVQPDGKILAVWGGNLVRLLPNGDPDPSFGDSGVVRLYGELEKIRLLGNGSILGIARWCSYSGLVKILPDGNLDPSFVPNEAWLLPPDGCYTDTMGGCGMVDATVDSEGRIPALYSCWGRWGLVEFRYLLRFLPNGEIDETYKYAQPPPTHPFQNYLVGDCRSIEVALDGNYLLACLTRGEWADTGYLGWGVRLVTYSSSPDPNSMQPPTIWETRFVAAAPTRSVYIGPIRSYPDGKVVLTACGTTSFIVARALADGSHDPTFGIDGKVEHANWGGEGDCPVFDTLVEPDGSIVGVGSAGSDSVGYPTRGTPVVSRFLVDGEPDDGFASGGFMWLHDLAPGYARGVAQQPDGKLLVAGSEIGPSIETSRAFVARLMPPALPMRPASYFAEGAAIDSIFESWILLSNPDPLSGARARVRLFASNGARAMVVVDLPPSSRRSLRVSAYIQGWEVSTDVQTVTGVVLAERAYYAVGGTYRGAMLSQPVLEPSVRWMTAEGATAGPFDTWIAVYNPHPYRRANLQARFLTAEGAVAGPAATLAPKGRLTLQVDHYVPGSYDVATEITADGPIVVERSTYLRPSPPLGGSATLSVASTSGATKWYFAEGSTMGFETWILVSNPTNQSADVTLWAATPSEYRRLTSRTVGPSARTTFRLGDYLPNAAEVATVVSSDVPVVSERAQYGVEGGLVDTAASSNGSTALSSRWLFPEGATAGDFRYFVTVLNPTNANALCALSMHGSWGPTGSVGFALGANGRATITVDDYVPDDYHVASQLVCDSPVTAEHSLYAGGGLSGDATSSPGIAIGRA